MRIQTSKKKKTALNLNVYRNLHHRSNNALKVKFKELAEKRLEGMPPLGRIRLHYSICPKSKRRLDIGNVGSIVDKFFSDVLTESGIIEDDDFTRLDFVSFGFGGLAKNEHVLVTITEIEERKDMQLSMTATLSDDDLKAAAAAWITEQTGQKATADDITITGEVTVTATLGDGPAADIGETLKPKAKRRTSAQVKADKETAAAEEATTDGDNDTTVSGGDDGDSGGSGEQPETEAEAPAETPSDEDEGKQPKNDSAASQDESSKDSDQPAAEEEAAPAPVKKPGKKSIFAQ